MAQLIGFVLMLALITGGLLSTGATAALAALPFELGLIGGTAFAALLIGNSPSIAMEALRGLSLAIFGSRWKRHDLTALMGCLHSLLTLHRRGGGPAIEAEFDNRQTSALLNATPRLLSDTDAVALLEEGLRLLSPAQDKAVGETTALSESLQRSIAGVHHRRMQAVGALQSIADALPALGIVAAVLGIIKTMTAIDQSDAVIGAMIATALLGTFLGVFLAYGLVGPLANRFGQVVDEELLALDVIETALSAAQQGAGPRRAIESARSVLPPALRPDDAALDERLESHMPVRLVRNRAA